MKQVGPTSSGSKVMFKAKVLVIKSRSNFKVTRIKIMVWCKRCIIRISYVIYESPTSFELVMVKVKEFEK